MTTKHIGYSVVYYPDEGVFFSRKERFICWVTQAQLLGPISGKFGQLFGPKIIFKTKI